MAAFYLVIRVLYECCNTLSYRLGFRTVCLREGDLEYLFFSLGQLVKVQYVAEAMSLDYERTVEDYDRTVTVSVKSSKLANFASAVKGAGVTSLGTLDPHDARALKLGRSLGFTVPL